MNTRVTSKPKILVLGATGMLGRIVFSYLKYKGLNVYGTSRKKSKLLKFSASEPDKHLRAIVKKHGRFDYVINCIALLQYPSEYEKKPTNYDFAVINTCLPQKLEEISDELGYKVVHISTNAVFKNVGLFYEDSPLSPESFYGMSKALGEVTGEKSITIRTSILGFDPVEKKGLLEMARSGEKIVGFSNHIFYGCTVLQLAKFIDSLVVSGGFDKLRKKTAVVHFFPLRGINKYRLLKEISHLCGSDTRIARGKAKNGMRQKLESKYVKETRLNKYEKDLKTTIKNLIKFEEIYE